ncbi:MAG: acetyl-CoA hydrolase/transferase family protein, partial [Chitinophagales bacterium]
MTPKIDYVSAEEALSCIQSGNTVFIHGSALTPIHMLHALAGMKDKLRKVQLVFISLYGDIRIDQPEYAEAFDLNAMFVSGNVRKSVNEGRADYIPVFLSEIPELFKQKVLDLDVAIVQVSPPDKHGYCSLGVSVDIARTAVNTAKYVIAQVNPNVPRTHGDSMIHSIRFHKMVWVDEPLQEVTFGEKSSEQDLKIGKYIAELIEDGSTLQMGIGSIPDAVLRFLTNHKNLGVHTEMFSDGLIPLFESDVINNKCKVIEPNRTVSGFALGTKKLYEYVNDNPGFAFLDIDFVNEPAVIKQNPKVVAINSCIEVDITGQVVADSIGTYQYSGVGGQMDFIRGAALSEGGKPIIALTSRTAKGISRIVPYIKQGAGVVTTRAHVRYIVTEYGVAFL